MTETNDLLGRRILVVEDEMMVAMMLEDMLQDAGCSVVSAGNVDQGLKLASDSDIEAAILDENLNGRQSYPIADALARRGIPFVFATGYGDRNLQALYPGRPVVSKPYSEELILSTLSRLIGQGQSR